MERSTILFLILGFNPMRYEMDIPLLIFRRYSVNADSMDEAITMFKEAYEEQDEASLATHNDKGACSHVHVETAQEPKDPEDKVTVLREAFTGYEIEFNTVDDLFAYNEEQEINDRNRERERNCPNL